MGFPKCIDCGKITSRYGCKRCIDCHIKELKKNPPTRGIVYTNEQKKNLHTLRKGKEHPSWKGGIIENSRGYMIKIAKNHPKKDFSGYVRLHRLIMEEHLGRYLRNDEVVHHKNGNKKDNRIENLQIMSNKEHALYHRSIQLI